MRRLIVLILTAVACAANSGTAFASGSDPQFTFSTDASNATTQCSVDGGAFTDCSSPQTLNLPAGTHTFVEKTTFTVAATGPTTYYVDNVAGSDSNPGTQAAPFATLAKAQSAAQSGDQIALLRGDTWTGGLDLKQSNVSVFGYGSAAARPIIQGGLNGDCIKFEGDGDQADNVELDNCGYAGAELYGAADSVINSKVTGNAAGVRTATGSTTAVIQGDKFVDNKVLNQNTSSGSSGAFSVLLNGDGATVSHDTMTGSEAPSQAYGWDGSAVEVYNGNNNTVDHNAGTNNDAFAELGGTSDGNTYAYNSETNDGTVDTQATGFVIPGSATNTTVQHDTMYLVGGTTQAFVCYSSCASSTKVQDDIFKATKEAVSMDGSGWTESGNVVNGPHNITLAASDSTADAVLANPPSDVSLTSSSPAIDRGSTQPYQTDLADNPSLVGAATDSGAYEFQTVQPPPDTTPPSTPTGLTVSNQTQTSLTLNWTASTDNVGVTGYDTSSNGTDTGNVTGTTKTYSGLTCGTTYTLGVNAFDAAGNHSGTATVQGTTADCGNSGSPLIGDTTVESTVHKFDVGTAQSAQFTATASGTTSSASFYVDQANLATHLYVGVYSIVSGKPSALLAKGDTGSLTKGAWNTLPLTSANLTAGTPYDLVVLGTGGDLYGEQAGSCTRYMASATGLTSLPNPFGATNTRVAGCPSVYVSGTVSVPDTTPPSTPTGAAVSSSTQTSLTLTWTASTDNVGVAGYDLLQDGTASGTTTSTSHVFGGLTCGTTYSLSVDAFDAAGNKSGVDTASGTTSACSVTDTTPPSTPTGLTVSGQTQTSLTLSWTASDDNGGGDNVTGYNTTLDGSSTGNVTGLTKTFSGLTCGTTYTVGVQAVDQAGNVSTAAITSGTTSACSTTGYQHIVWVVMENHSYSDIHGSSSAPYINSLMSQYGNLTNMHATSHPSAPNYVDMTSGGNGNCCTDDGYHNLNVPSIFSQLGTGARSLEESMPSPCDTGNSGNYAIRHNPEPYYLANIGQTLCNSQDVALGATLDLSAKFTFITPNLCHDMHSNSCSGSSDVIKQGDDFLKGLVPQLLNSPQYQAGNTAIFITWDEDHTSNLVPNQIPTIVINPSVSGGGQACSSTNFNHYSMLQYVEDTFGQAHLGGAAGATSMKGCDGL